MTRMIDRSEVQRVMERSDVTLVEVLGEDAYNAWHLPGAVNAPIGSDFEHHIAEVAPDKGKPVIVYCADTDCDASPKAAERMEAMGYEQVFDYAAGKEDWKAAGLPVES